MSCGVGFDQNFHDQLLKDWFNSKARHFAFVRANKPKLQINSQILGQTALPTLRKFRSQLEDYTNFSDNFFNKDWSISSSSGGENIFEPLTILTTMTNYEVRNSYQLSQGDCFKQRDQWVLKSDECFHSYEFLKNDNATNLQSFESNSNPKNRNCFAILEWSNELVATRYNSVFHDCRAIPKDQSNPENGDEVPYSETVVNFHNNTYNFFQSISKSVKKTYSDFDQIVKTLATADDMIFELSTALEREVGNVEDLSKDLDLFHRSNNCSFVHPHINQLFEDFCGAEKRSLDKYYQAIKLSSVLTLVIGILLACLGSCFYYNPQDPVDYRELEMETVMGREDEDEDNTISYEWMGVTKRANRS